MPAASPAWRVEARATLALALPLVAANLLQMAVYAVDVIFVARLGPQSLAASSLSVSILGLLLWSSTGLVGAVSPLVAAELGRRRHAVREVRRSFRMGLWLSALASAVVLLLCAAGPWFMQATGQDADVVATARPFLHILMWSTPPAIVAAMLRSFVAAMGRAAVATLIIALGLAINIVGNYALVFGHFGCPALGLQGSAISSIVTTSGMLLAYVAVILTDRRLRRYHLFGRWWRADWVRFLDLLRVGLPICGTIVAEAGLFSGAAFLMGRIGEAELAGHTIALQIAAVAFQIPFGIAQAGTIRVGYAFGAGDRAGIARAGNAAIILGIAVMTLTASAMWFAPRQLLSLYVDTDAPENAVLVAFALQYMIVAAAFQLADGAQAVAAGALRGLQDTRVPMAIAVFGYWLPGFGTAIVLGFYTPLRGLGVWIGLAVGLLVVAILLLYRWSRRDRLLMSLSATTP
ncbi:putative multidrug resistance protein NorM [Sphingomonas antarctica]|uniref:MATE family efflux transporter n=1 Tax=Sphingomonas antarctica TaxID=2040274 RepID=UPI0039EA5748